MSPTTGSLFTTTVEIDNIPRDSVGEILPEDVLRETQEVFNEMEFNSATQEQCNEDVRAYEMKLRNAGKATRGSKRERKAKDYRGRSSSDEE